MRRMERLLMSNTLVVRPAATDVLELLKPITWFPPMWAFGCGVVSSGEPLSQRWPLVIAGIILAGPMLCGMSQAVNDWYDRHVDAINEPNRPIPSGRIPGSWGFYIAVAWSVLSMMLAATLGPWVFVAAALGLVMAWAYSMPPVRLKQNGWFGNAACGLAYESLPWFTGAAVMSASIPDWRIIVVALLYGIGAHGIMTLNDFKAIDGDKKMGVNSLPVLLGAENAARLACVVMAVPQLVVVALLFAWDRPYYAIAVSALLVLQLGFMSHLLKAPRERAPWYNGTGVSSYVLGMLVSAFALSSIGGS